MRRTPKLTDEARNLFVEELRERGGWQPGGTINRIASATGLTAEQARDAIFAPSADEWRRNLPFYQGRKVTNDEWVALRSGDAVDWKEATGYNDGSEAASEATAEATEPVKKPRSRRSASKKAQAEAAIVAATGQDIDLDDNEELPEVNVEVEDE